MGHAGIEDARELGLDQLVEVLDLPQCLDGSLSWLELFAYCIWIVIAVAQQQLDAVNCQSAHLPQIGFGVNPGLSGHYDRSLGAIGRVKVVHWM